MHNQTNQTNQNANDVEIVFAEMVESPNKLAAAVPVAAATPHAEHTSTENRRSPAPRKTAGQFIESLLDPKSLQTLMWFGSGLLVVGLMIWLWSVGVFAKPIVAAAIMGGANLAALIVGLVGAKCKRFSKRFSERYSWAGKAITLLSCMVMPLNLWFYHSHGLLTLDQNGLLCIPALMMTAIYGVVARTLKDANFVYATVAGVVMTGLIFLADSFVGTWQLAPPAILLVVIGIVCIHVQRLFPTDADSPFSQKTFGKAFFASGHVVMAAGLLVTLVGNWLEIGTQTAAFYFTSLVLSAAGFYAYLYSLGLANSQPNQKGKNDQSIATAVYLGGIAVCLLIFCLAIAEVISFKIAATFLIGALSAVAIGFQTFALAKRNASASQFGIVASVVAMIISAVVLLMSGITLSGESLVTGWLVASMALNVASFVMAVMFPHEKENGLMIGSVIGIVASGLMMLLSIMILLEFSSVGSVLVALMGIPFVLQLAGAWKKESESKLWFFNASQVAGAVLISMALIFVGIFGQEFMFWDQFMFCVFSLLNTILFVRCDGKMAGIVAAFSMMAAIGFGAWAFGLGGFASVKLASFIGLVMMAIGRLVKIKAKAQSFVSLRMETMGTLIVVLASSLSFALFLWHVLDSATWSLASFMGIQLAVSVGAALLSTDKQLSKFHFGAAFGQFASMILTAVLLAQLGFFNQVEIMFSAVGMFVLLLSHFGWFREDGQVDHTQSSISAGLWIGSILAIAPMLISLLLHRIVGFNVSETWLLIHNLGVLAVGMAMLLAGLACRIRSTTIVGAGTVVAYVLSLVTLLHIPAAMQNIAVYMMIGGGVFFGVAIVLSMYRSHLLAMPEKIRKGQGIFQVLKWR